MNINSVNQTFYDLIDVFQDYRQFGGDRVAPQATVSVGMLQQATRGNSILISNPSIELNESNAFSSQTCRVVIEFYSTDFNWAIESADAFAEMFNTFSYVSGDSTQHIHHSSTTADELARDGYVAAVTYEVKEYAP